MSNVPTSRTLCPVCRQILTEAFYPATGIWRTEGCEFCTQAKRREMEMEPGTSLRFKQTASVKGQRQAVIEGGFTYVEVTPEQAARCRYYGDMAWIEEEECVVAIFLDPVTGHFFGQPV